MLTGASGSDLPYCLSHRRVKYPRCYKLRRPTINVLVQFVTFPHTPPLVLWRKQRVRVDIACCRSGWQRKGMRPFYAICAARSHTQLCMNLKLLQQKHKRRLSVYKTCDWGLYDWLVDIWWTETNTLRHYKSSSVMGTYWVLTHVFSSA